VPGSDGLDIRRPVVRNALGMVALINREARSMAFAGVHTIVRYLADR
jgi:hypothetical protein